MGKTEEVEKVLFLPDTHCPYHDRRAYDLVESVVRGVRPGFRRIRILGDFPDFYAISAHSKDPGRRETFEDEVEETKKLLRRIERWNIPDKEYIEGNHEWRLDRYIQDNAKELHGILTLDRLLHISENGWKVTKYKDHVKLGRLWLTHDLGKAGQNAVKDALTSYQDNVVIGHLHRLLYMVEGNAKGVPHVAACFGWLGDVSKVDYMYRVKANRDWALGFGVGYLRPNGVIHLQPVPIVDYSCVVDGKLFSV